ncbi:MAG: DNA/RNA non-specific endonuclease [Acidimicrobiales bacterium]
MPRKVFFTTTADGKVHATPAHPDTDPDDTTPGATLSTEFATEYRQRWGADQTLDVFQGQNGFRYLFDSSPSGRTDHAKPANRVVAAWGYSKPDERVGSRNRLRQFPLPPRDEALDRGHLIALASGGGENVNIVPQASKLNRGHTSAGKRWRALERRCAATPGVFMFVGLRYTDVSDVPAELEFHIIDPDGTVQVEAFDNTNADVPASPDDPR